MIFYDTDMRLARYQVNSTNVEKTILLCNVRIEAGVDEGVIRMELEPSNKIISS
jgi:hypothetical protein